MEGHQHHGHHHMMENATQATSLTTAIPNVTSTIFQAILTTVMSHNHSGHPGPHIPKEHGSSSHFTNSNFDDSGLDSPHIVDHSVHLAGSPSDHSSNLGHDMIMYFHSSVDAIILFKEWNVSTSQGLIGSVIGIFIMAMLYEGIKFFREYMFKKYFTSLEYSSVSVLGDDGKTVTEVHKVARNRMFSWPHLLQTFLHVVQMVLSYFLMLIFMTYNVWLCLGVVLGAGTGYFLFGWKKATVVDITEHCH